jgi:PAS domain S-box-containing protein
MTVARARTPQDLALRLAEAEATIDALLSGQIDAVVDSRTKTPVLLSKAQDALRESEERYRRIVETASEGIWTVDSEARITFVNPCLATMLGYTQAQMLGKPSFQFIPDLSKEPATLRLERSRQGITDETEVRLERRDGSELWVLLKTSSIKDANGKHIGTLAMMTDRTHHRQAEEVQKTLQSQLMVSDRMASVGTLAAGVAHEINNPLAAVIANLDYVAESLGRMVVSNAEPATRERSDVWILEEIKTPLDEAREAAERVRFIVRDLKMFSRSPSEEPRSVVDVKAIMESSLRMAWNEIRHRARLVKNYGPMLGVRANEARLGQVFLNLVVNAAQAMPEGRAESNEIRVTTRLSGDRAIIDVADTGAGIPPEIIGRVFDAFYTTKAVGVGTGLGLAICQRIVTDMDGTLTVESKVGKGTTFCVSLPAANQTREHETVAAVQAMPVATRRGRILVVDDEELVVRSVKRILSNDHDVVATVSAAEALALCTTGGEKFDLILCDLMMPDMTGMDLHHELSRLAPEQAGRMIFVTGGAFTEKARRFLSESPKESLEKPFYSANLRAIVARYLR